MSTKSTRKVKKNMPKQNEDDDEEIIYEGVKIIDFTDLYKVLNFKLEFNHNNSDNKE